MCIQQDLWPFGPYGVDADGVRDLHKHRGARPRTDHSSRTPPEAGIRQLRRQGFGGYVFFVPTDFNDANNITQLSNYLWVDEKTRGVQVVFIVYNGNFGLFNLVRIDFEFELGGRVSSEITVRWMLPSPRLCVRYLTPRCNYQHGRSRADRISS